MQPLTWKIDAHAEMLCRVGDFTEIISNFLIQLILFQQDCADEFEWIGLQGSRNLQLGDLSLTHRASCAFLQPNADRHANLEVVELGLHTFSVPEFPRAQYGLISYGGVKSFINKDESPQSMNPQHGPTSCRPSPKVCKRRASGEEFAARGPSMVRKPHT